MASESYDYDSVQPFFYFVNEEEFYQQQHSQSQPPVPSEDIWKKFELLATLPLSPCSLPWLFSLFLSTADQLEMVTEYPSGDMVDQSFICDAGHSQSFLNSIMIQDCMWSGFSHAAVKMEKVVSERLASLQDHDSSLSECIDPSVVFPFPPRGKPKPSETARPSALPFSPDTPPNSASGGSSSDRDSDDGNADDKEEEEEETVVLTVKKRKTMKRAEASGGPRRPPYNPLAWHNYAKRMKFDSSGELLMPKSTDRRRAHNMLERKRMKNLKLRFLALRVQMPEVGKYEKATKAVVLKGATECIFGMQSDELRLLSLKEQLRKRRDRLNHRLEQLMSLHV